MADDADTTADRDEAEAPLRLARSWRDPGPAATGKCHWCHEPVAGSLRYCDADCQADHGRALRHKGVRA